MKVNPRLTKLFLHSKKIRLLNSISSLLEWDQETHMPPLGAVVRSQQLELMAGLAHKEATSKRFAALLKEHVDLKTGKLKSKQYTQQEKAALREWRRDYLKAASLPNRFVKAFAKLNAESIVIWTTARKENNFALFLPYLEKIVGFSREKAELLGYLRSPYDALLDEYEQGMSVQIIQPLFIELQHNLSDLLRVIMNSKKIDNQFLYAKFSHKKQIELSHILLKAMGYDFQKGRLDLSTHPFSTSFHPFDSRITTRFSGSIIDMISTVLHEGGHSLYEMALPVETYGSPLSESVSLGIHESQSRFWETCIGQSKPFWTFFYPILKQFFPKEFQGISLEHLYQSLNKVSPGFIRVESDEVTYCLHVILRFEIEKHLIEGTLAVKDIPEAWNELMKRFLNLTPPSDREGCLQDVHWSMGAFGYFPTYALGNLYAAQFFDAFISDYPDWAEKVACGDLLFITEWLRTHIHIFGRMYPPGELALKVTGQKLSPQPYLDYLTKKYLEIYECV